MRIGFARGPGPLPQESSTVSQPFDAALNDIARRSASRVRFARENSGRWMADWTWACD